MKSKSDLSIRTMSMIFVLLGLYSSVFSSNHVSDAAFCSVERCTRIPKIENFGFGIAKRRLFIDTGECHTSYPSNISLSCFEQNTCLPRCEPRSYDLQLHSNRSGPITVPVVRSCYATAHHCRKDCKRISKIQYFFPNSKYETRVDVGSCGGSCPNENNQNCVATSIESKSVEGPNGDVIAEVIKGCECATKECYRVDYWKSYWNHSKCENSTLRTEKLINVGRCQGDCSRVFLPGRCYPSEENCLLYIPGGSTQCVPIKDRSDSYFDVDLKEQTVQIVDECGCSSA